MSRSRPEFGGYGRGVLAYFVGLALVAVAKSNVQTIRQTDKLSKNLPDRTRARASCIAVKRGRSGTRQEGFRDYAARNSTGCTRRARRCRAVDREATRGNRSPSGQPLVRKIEISHTLATPMGYRLA